MKLQILLMLIVASVSCFARSESSADNTKTSGAIAVLRAELREVQPNEATALGGQDGDLEGSESNHRIVIKPVRKVRGKRIRIRLVNAKKPSKYIRLKVAGTKNVEQSKNPDEYEDGSSTSSNWSTDPDNLGAGDGDSDNDGTSYPDDEVVEETVNGEDNMKVKHHHHHHHHNHIKTVVKKVPEPYAVEKIIHVPVEKIVHVPKPYPVEKVVEKIVHVPVEKVVEKIIHIPKPYPVEKIVHVPKIVEKIIHVPMYKDAHKYSSSHSSPPSLYTDLTNDSKLKFGDSSIDIVYPNKYSPTGTTTTTISSGPHKKQPQFKFPDYLDINKSPPKFHSVLNNDNFNFGDAFTSKPKDTTRPQNNNSGSSNSGSGEKKKRRNRNKKNKKTNSIQDTLNSHSHVHSSLSQSYGGFTMPSYTHEYHLSSSDNKEVYVPTTPMPLLSGYDSKTIVKYGGEDEMTMFSSSPQEEEYLNWTPQLSENVSPTSYHLLPSVSEQSLSNSHNNNKNDESSSQFASVFNPPKKSSKKSFKAPRAGPKQTRNSSEGFFRSPAPVHEQSRPSSSFSFPRFSRSDKVDSNTANPLKLTSIESPVKISSPFIKSVMTPPAL